MFQLLQKSCARFSTVRLIAVAAITILAVCSAVTVAQAAPTLQNTTDLSPGTDAYRPFQFTLNASTHKLYVVGGYYSGSLKYHYGLKVIDTTSGTVTGGVELAASTRDSYDGSFQPYAAAADDSAGPAGNKVYVVGDVFLYRNNHLVLRVVDGATDTNLTDPSTDLVLNNSDPGRLAAANFITVNPVTHKVYVVDGNDQLFIIDGPNRRVLSSFKLPVTDAYNAVVNRTANKLFYFSGGNQGQNGAAMLDGASDVVTPLTTPFSTVLGATIDEAASRIYVLARANSNQALTLYALDASSGAVVASSALSGAAPDFASLAFDATNRVLYATNVAYQGNLSNPTITSYDPTTLAARGTFAHGGGRLSFDSGRLFIVGNVIELANAVGILNPTNGAFTKTTVAYRPAAMAVNSQTGRVYTYDVATNEVPVIDITSGAVIKRFPVIGARDGGPGYDGGGDHDSIAVSAAVNRFYRTHVNSVTDPNGFSAHNVLFLDVYDGENGQLIKTVQLDDSGYSANGLVAVDDTHRRVYATGIAFINGAQTATGAVFVLDADSNALLATIDSGVGSGNGLAVNPVTRRIYVTSGAGVGKLSIIDGATNTLVTVLDTTNGYPDRIAFNTKTNMGYIACTGGADHGVDIIDGATDSIVGNFNDGSQNPYDTAYNVAVDEATNTVFVLDDSVASNDFTGGVLAFDANNNYRQIAQVELGDFPRGMVFDPKTHRLFVSNIGDGTVSVVQGDASSGTTHPAFFAGEVPLSNGVYYLQFASGNPFGYYSYLSDPHYIFHFDLGYEYVFDANDGKSGVYLYDFKSQGFFYTAPGFPFPYLYDFSLNSVVYYYPDPSNPGHYNTNGVRYFYVFSTGKIISK